MRRWLWPRWYSSAATVALGGERERKQRRGEARERVKERGREVRGSTREIQGVEGSGKQEVAGARVRARRPHALLPTRRRWKTTGRRRWAGPATWAARWAAHVT